MPKRKLTVFLGSFLLIAALLLAFSPFHAGNAGATDPAVAFANAHWNCATAACTTKVAAGAGQTGYQCAEFAARSLAADGYIPGLSTTSAQSAYESYKPGNGKTYDLLAITPSVAAPKLTLANFLTTFGYFKNVGETPGDAEPGDLIVFKDSSGVAEHVMIIVSSSFTVASIRLDGHNDARHNYGLNAELSSGGFSSWYLLHIQTGA